jgi:hypothetical protein
MGRCAVVPEIKWMMMMMIQREICSMFMRVNVLIRRFCKCSVAVKCVLFKSFCLCLYDAALWSKCLVRKLNKLRSCYTKCIKNFWGIGEMTA